MLTTECGNEGKGFMLFSSLFDPGKEEKEGRGEKRRTDCQFLNATKIAFGFVMERRILLPGQLKFQTTQ